MKTKSQARGSFITLDAPMALFASGDDESAVEFEREIALTGEYKTRKFALDRKQFEQVIANHKASGVDPAVDLGHESLTDSSKPAAGWVRELSIRPSQSKPGRDALVAKFVLNDIGSQHVKNQHFRYLSVGIDLKAKNKQTGEDIGAELDHLALVKRPFIEGMQPLSLSFTPTAEEQTMKLTLKALGLDSSAEDDEARDVVVALKSFQRNIITLSGKSTADEAIGSISALVAKAERADKAEAELQALKAEQLKAEADRLIGEAVADGRCFPTTEIVANQPTKGSALNMLAIAGMPGLRCYLDGLQKKIALTAAESPAEEKGSSVAAAYSAEEIAVARNFCGDDKLAIAERIKGIRELNAKYDSVAPIK